MNRIFFLSEIISLPSSITVLKGSASVVILNRFLRMKKRKRMMTMMKRRRSLKKTRLVQRRAMKMGMRRRKMTM